MCLFIFQFVEKMELVKTILLPVTFLDTENDVSLAVYNYVSSRYLKVKVYLKLLISQSKFSGPRIEMLRKIGNVID